MEKRFYGETADGRKVYAYLLTNGHGTTAELINYGCVLRSLCVRDRDGRLVDVVLGYDHFHTYEISDGNLGTVVGRYGNRIGNGTFHIGSNTYHLAKNNGSNSLHGGNVGFDKRVWDAEEGENKVTFTRLSPDGEEGYPGNLLASVAYTLTEDDTLVIEYSAKSDQDTIVNLTNHTYFNLAGEGTVLDHLLTLHADAITENDEGCLPTGVIAPVEGTPFDFRTAKAIGRDINAENVQLAYGKGYDHNYVLDKEPGCRPAAELYCDKTGIRMKVSTTTPGVQVYTANNLTERAGRDGAVYGPRSGICLETQQFPDAPNKPNFPSALLKKGETSYQRTEFAFSAE